MDLDAIKKLRQRRIISQREEAQLESFLMNAYETLMNYDVWERLFIKVSQWVETTRFEQARLDQVLSGKLLVWLSADRRKLEFHAPLEGDSSSTRGPNREPAPLRDRAASLSEPVLRSLDVTREESGPRNPTDGEDTNQ